jgi:hypothetical protein
MKDKRFALMFALMVVSQFHLVADEPAKSIP